MDYAKMRAIAEELGAYAERFEGAWSVEIGPSGPVLAMMCPSKRHEGTIRRICKQLDAQLLGTHPGYICANGPEVEHPGIGRMRLPDAAVIPEEALDEEGLAVDAVQVLAVVEIVSPSNPNNDYVEKLADYPAMGIPHYLIVDPRTGTVEVHSEPCRGRYTRKDPYIYGDKVPFGPWTVDTGDFRRYGRAGDGVD
ncbi:Uma2 family endonuclease [Streptomyces sp. NPDC003401]